MRDDPFDGIVAAVGDEKRDTVVSARFTKSEAERLRAAAGDRSAAQLLRELAMAHLDGGSEQPAPTRARPYGYGSSLGATGTVGVSNAYGMTAPRGRSALIVSGTQVSVGTA